jgi:hypothetical protein
MYPEIQTLITVLIVFVVVVIASVVVNIWRGK